MSSIVVSGDTSGSVTLQAPAVAGSTVLTLPAQTGTVMVNGPAFSAYQSSAQTLTSNTWTKVQFQTKEFDTNNNFDNVTNYRFTPTVAGYYQVDANVFSSAFNLVACSIYKNGSSFKSGPETQYAALPLAMGMSCLIYLNGSTDYIECYAYLASSTALGAASNLTYFQAFLARSA